MKFIKKEFLFPILICSVILIFYNQAFHNEILSWDDNLYLIDNPQVQNLSSIPSYFSHFDNTGNYMPFTLSTFTILYHFSELHPFLYHFINILFHILNSLLVFYFIYKLLKNIDLALITALLFSTHPIHVESVAWIAELKDVQYTFFFLLSMIFYLKFVRNRKPSNYILSIIFFISSVFSKGQAVALFPVILLIDYLENRKIFTKLIEKIPYLLISISFGIIAILAQKAGNNISDYNVISFFDRIVLASYAFTTYIIKVFIPYELSAFYPYPEMIDGKLPLQYLPFLLIIPLTIYVLILSYKKNKLVFFGLTFFISNIILLLQLIPVGNCIMADRYTYIASIGISLIVAHYIIKLYNLNKYRTYIVSFFVIYLLFLGINTHSQTKLWKNDFVLWDNVLKVNPKIPSALVLRGCAYNTMKKFNEAIPDFDKAIEIDNKNTLAYLNRGVSKSSIGKFKEAITDFEIANVLKPEPRYLVNFYVSWGGALANTGKLNEALIIFDRAIAINPNKASIYNNRGITQAMLGMMPEALNDFEFAVKLEPNYKEAVENRNRALNAINSPNK